LVAALDKYTAGPAGEEQQRTAGLTASSELAAAGELGFCKSELADEP
tara:strand:+ start:18699 stop:18839 length:141 start_codon:yes stop_codon:yes gene_type:complete